jgi:hypothetical protein
MVSDMMDFRSYSTSSNEVFAKTKPKNPIILELNSENTDRLENKQNHPSIEICVCLLS